MSDTSKQQPDKENDDELIVTPINIARARHASSHGHPVVDKTRQISAIKDKKQQPTADKPIISISGFQFDGINSCLLLFLLGVAFLAGGILGGMGGGWMIVWANSNGEGLPSLSASLPTPVIFTPTPIPVATITPTSAPQPTATPSIEDMIAQTVPSVVTIINRQLNKYSFETNNNGKVVGSGVILDPRGYIATNNHVIKNSADLRIILYDGREVQAELIAAKPAEDLAIIKINVSNLPAIKLGNSKTVRPGQVVYAIGSPLGDFPNSVSFGVISGLNRALEMDGHVIDGLIQTDAAINRGSSGGPLINAKGQMIGINTFIIRESGDQGIAEGIAFSIPSERAKRILLPWITTRTGEAIPIPASEATGGN